MKRSARRGPLTRIFLFLLPAALLFSLLPVTAAEEPEQELDGWSVLLREGCTLTERISLSGSDRQAEHLLVLEPESMLRPVIAAGQKVCSTAVPASLAADRPDTVAACLNGGYFNFSTRDPIGLLITEGVLRAGDEGLQALGFRNDGSAVTGTPDFSLSLTAGEDALVLRDLNEPDAAGAVLFTADYGGRIRCSAGSVCLRCSMDGTLRPGGEASLTVLERFTCPEALALTDPDCWLRFPESEAPDWQAGDVLALTVSCREEWTDVESAVGILYPLIISGELTGVSDGAAAPRSAVGLRADGTLLFYTVDGRQTGISAGRSLTDTASRLLELGCVWAGALDGGGSTCCAAVLPGTDSLRTVSSPSGGTVRSVNNALCLVTDCSPTGEAVRLVAMPYRLNILVGSSVRPEILAVDANGFAAPVPDSLTFTVSDDLGRMEEDGSFRALQAGTGTLTVSAPGLESAEIPVRVFPEADTLALYGEVYGKLTQKLSLEPGQEVDLTVRASAAGVTLTCEDTAFVWSLEPGAGTVDETGHLTPAEDSGFGMLTVSSGASSVSIPITIVGELPFHDVRKADPYYEEIRFVWQNGIFNGISSTAFGGSGNMTRSMAVTVLWRIAGSPEPTAEAGFLDLEPGSWYEQAVLWAAEVGCVNGYSETVFAPDDLVTGEQLIAILHRFAGSPEVAEKPVISGASDWAAEALSWAAGAETAILREDDPLFLPGSAISRRDVAVCLTRFLMLPDAE